MKKMVLILGLMLVMSYCVLVFADEPTQPVAPVSAVPSQEADQETIESLLGRFVKTADDAVQMKGILDLIKTFIEQDAIDEERVTETLREAQAENKALKELVGLLVAAITQPRSPEADQPGQPSQPTGQAGQQIIDPRTLPAVKVADVEAWANRRAYVTSADAPSNFDLKITCPDETVYLQIWHKEMAVELLFVRGDWASHYLYGGEPALYRVPTAEGTLVARVFDRATGRYMMTLEKEYKVIKWGHRVRFD